MSEYITSVRSQLCYLKLSNKSKGGTKIIYLDLEAFTVDNGRSRFIVFFLGDPHLLESGEGSQDGSTNPDGVFAFRRSNDLNLDCGRSQVDEFLLHAVGNSREHGCSTRED